ncbi:heptaprenyl diphosphate synthase component 1 [Mechercharimyces sp. CAU 1602]|uniref:heptaprenyl diphosphate synthase component 1 n=1 Tax=Mechercharimyces sp. CAU 1602 TaxID=2973933 RepID=UPI002162B291|nr:heptaprenyl diphosphate synthase component 1 [Mechercharimyces sp. CAU 1602]MCS1350978.1 heptaprenyl diphosphate synthase component 1 [Mechercharimyces sp. CAU 1602]
MTSIDKELGGVRSVLAADISHPYLEKNIGQIQIPDFYTGLVYAAVQSGSLASERVNAVSSAIILLQMGLDIHDHVSVDGEETLTGMRKRQLMVLAGDYFSSLFYRRLAEVGEISLVALISEGIWQMNQAKVDLYTKTEEAGYNGLSSKEKVSYLTSIRSNILVKTTQYFTGTDRGTWEELIHHLIWADCLCEEQQRGAAELQLMKEEAELSIKKAMFLLDQLQSVDVRFFLQELIQRRFGAMAQEPVGREG